MCLGIPMTVVAPLGAGMAQCRAGDGSERVVSLLLLGDVAPGTPVLVHVDTAVRVLDPSEMKPIEDALEALAASLEGRPFDHLFADLIGRTPQLPPHLRTPAAPGDAA
jgi:hydrogenase expression/formation protein HypC